MDDIPKVNKSIALWMLGFLVGSDILLWLLQKMNYYPAPYLKLPGFYMVLYHILLLVVILTLLDKILLMALLVPCFLFTLWFTYFWFALMMDKDQLYVHSPAQSETLVVQYQVTNWWDTKYSYEFYQEVFHGLFLKKLEGQEYTEIIADYSQHRTPEEVLGLDSAEWVDEKQVIFETADGQKKIVME